MLTVAGKEYVWCISDYSNRIRDKHERVISEVLSGFQRGRHADQVFIVVHIG